jgi:hypothetical protein
MDKYQRWLLNLSPTEKCFIWRNHHRKTKPSELERYRERATKIASRFEIDKERDAPLRSFYKSLLIQKKKRDEKNER